MYNTLLRFFPFLKNKQADPLETLGSALVIYLSTLNKEEQDKIITGLSMSSLKVSTVLKENNLSPVHPLVPGRTYMIEPTLLPSPFSSTELIAQALLVPTGETEDKADGDENEHLREMFPAEETVVAGDAFLSNMGYSAAMFSDSVQEPELIDDSDVGIEEDSIFDDNNGIDENNPFGLGLDESEDETEEDGSSDDGSGEGEDFFTIGNSDNEDSVDTIVEKKGSV